MPLLFQKQCKGNTFGVLFVLLIVFVVDIHYAKAAPTDPIVLYTDAPSGPLSGGENNKGAYLSIFGKNFGSSGLGTTTKVYIGGVEVDNYRYLGASKVYDKLGIQQITVQVGALGGPTLGTPIAVKVTVNGIDSNTDKTFTPNPGNIYFVSNGTGSATIGNDSTAVANDITHPYRYLQTSSFGGAYSAVRAGDHIVIRGGNWSDQGGYTAWLRTQGATQNGSSPTGSSGTGWVHMTAYPGPVDGNAIEEVHYTTPNITNTKGGIQGDANTYGRYFSVSNLHLESSALANSDGAPINVQSAGGPWRIVNNELGPWPSTLAAPGNAKAGGIASSEGAALNIYGNYIHDIACAQGQSSNPLENHGIYLDYDGIYDIAFNNFQNIPGGSGLQLYNANATTSNVTFHHNVLNSIGKHGINVVNFGTGLKIYDNLITNTQYGGMRFDGATLSGAKVYNNTFYNTYLASTDPGWSGYATITDNQGLTSGMVEFKNNIFYPRTSTFYIGGTMSGSPVYSNNLWFGTSIGDTPPSSDVAKVITNPQFMTLGSDYHLQSGSPAINAGTAPFAGFLSSDPYLAYDLDMNVRSSFDIGAYEYISGAPDTTPPVRSAGAPGGALASGITSTTMSLTTDETATCKYGTTANIPYASIANTFTTTGSTSHSKDLTGLSSGTSYTYYVRCIDTATNANLDDYTITFSVASAGDTTPPTIPTLLTATAVSTTGINLSWTASTDAVGVTGYKVYRGGTQIATVTSGTAYSDTGLTASTLYTYTVLAYDGTGNESASSSSASATTQSVTVTSSSSSSSHHSSHKKKKKGSSVSSKIIYKQGERIRPFITIVSPRVGTQATKSLSITASASDRSGIQAMIISVNGTKKKRTNTGSIFYTATIKGQTSINIAAYDTLGNQKSSVITISGGKVVGVRYY